MQDTNQAFATRVTAGSEFSHKRRTKTVSNDVVYYDDTVRWPIWQSALLVIGVCATFWGGVIYLGLKVFGA